MKKLIALGAAAALALAGCSSVPAPAVTVTETKTASSNSSSSNSSSSTLSVEEEFVFLMMSVGTPSWMLEGDALDILISQAKDVCGYIADGDSPDDIVWVMTLAASQSDVSDEIVDAFLAAAVAGTYTYCPQYEGFWD